MEHRTTLQADNLVYRCKLCSQMTETEISEASCLFSENYGFWSKNLQAQRAGQQIKFAPKMIKESFVLKPDRYVAMVYHKQELIGHAFYLRRKVESLGYITWILQLVVKKEYRGNNIGTKIMHSIWNLSDSYAWGLYTSNPMTIFALENATMRPVNVGLINKHIDKLRQAAFDLFSDTSWIDSYSKGMVNTNFWTDHSDLKEKIGQFEKTRPFGLKKDLPEGYEWLAFTFRSQEPKLATKEQMETYFNFSESVLFEAYSHMDMKKHKWAAHADAEIEYLEGFFNDNCDILDLGCGHGRHSEILAKKGHRVVAVDLINPPPQEQMKDANPLYVCADARTFVTDRKFDVVLCLYDVIGSFPQNRDNLRILETAYKHLKPGGHLILSVMNYSLTLKNCRKHNNLVQSETEGYRRIFKLRGSDTMQKSGDIFDGKLTILNTSNGVCYHKEQFFSERYLPKEYLIRDRRYSFNGISNLVRKAGFEVDLIHAFRAGHMNESLKENDKGGKEILIVARKVRPLNAFIQRVTIHVDE